jgi:hypothetical protein
MVYGRRLFNRTRRKLSPEEQQTERLQASQRSLENMYRHFQRRYATYFLLAILGPFALFVVPCIYFISQNYEIFYQLAYDIRPDLLVYLDREKGVLFGLILFSVIISSVFCFWITQQIMSILAGPIWALERHMKQVTLGNWSSKDFHIRAEDEFQSLASTYSYLYRTLRVNTQYELEQLESLGLDPRDRHTYMVLKNLIDAKRAQLGLSNEDKRSDSQARPEKERKIAS